MKYRAHASYNKLQLIYLNIGQFFKVNNVEYILHLLDYSSLFFFFL